MIYLQKRDSDYVFSFQQISKSANQQSMKAHSVQQIPNTLLGEGPVWDYRSQKLWWVDITNGLLHRYDPQGTSQTFNIGQMVGAA